MCCDGEYCCEYDAGSDVPITALLTSIFCNALAGVPFAVVVCFVARLITNREESAGEEMEMEVEMELTEVRLEGGKPQGNIV